MVRGGGFYVFIRSGTGGSPDFGAMAVGALIALLPNTDRAVDMVWRIVMRERRDTTEPPESPSQP